MSLYPLTMGFPSSLQHVKVVITAEGWRFEDKAAQVIFAELPVAERLDLRRHFEAQVALAKSTTPKNFRATDERNS